MHTYHELFNIVFNVCWCSDQIIHRWEYFSVQCECRWMFVRLREKNGILSHQSIHYVNSCLNVAIDARAYLFRRILHFVSKDLLGIIRLLHHIDASNQSHEMSALELCLHPFITLTSRFVGKCRTSELIFDTLTAANVAHYITCWIYRIGTEKRNAEKKNSVRSGYCVSFSGKLLGDISGIDRALRYGEAIFWYFSEGNCLLQNEIQILAEKIYLNIV